MADTLSFTPEGGSAVVITPIKGTVKWGGGHDDRGGGTIPPVRAGYAYNGSCQVLVDGTAPTLATLLGLRSAVGEGNVDIVGAGRYAACKSFDALVDVSLEGDSVQIASIEWKGTAAPAT